MAPAESKPVAACMLAIVGVALQVISALVLVYVVFFFAPFIEGWWGYKIMGPWIMQHRNAYSLGYVWVSVWMGVMTAVIGLGAYGTFLMNSVDIEKVRTGATLVLVASVVAFPTMWGFFIGSLLMFIGSLLGLTWQPSA